MSSFSDVFLKLALALVAVIAVLTLGGCQTYDNHSFASSYQLGSYEAAAAQIEMLGAGAMRDPANGDHLIYLLEDGAIRRTQGNLQASTQSFEKADEFFQKIDQKAQVRIGRGVKAAVSNLAELQYEGTGYDRMMMNTYKALNYMEEGNLDYARAELKRVAYVQQMIEKRKADRIREAQEDASSSGNVNADAAEDPGLIAQTRALYPDLPDNRLRSAYVNAFAEYLQGVFLLNTGDASDRETARVSLRKTLSMIANPYVQQDLQAAEAARVLPVTYVILESGTAPLREECRIDIPIWFFNLAFHDSGVDYVGVAFPKLVPQPDGMPFVQARTAGGAFPTQLLVDMDAVITREFKDDMPTVITRTIIAAATKAGVAYAANRATHKDPLLNLATRIGTTLFQYSVNRADLRTWRTLPKTISISRFPTPPDGNVTLLSPAGGAIANMRLDPNAVNVIWVRSPSDSMGTVCRAFRLAAAWPAETLPPVRAEDAPAATGAQQPNERQ